MTDQEIIDAIDAEIYESRDLDRTIRAAYTEGLRFARQLIERRIEDNRPASFIEHVFGCLLIMGTGAFLFYVATRLGK